MSNAASTGFIRQARAAGVALAVAHPSKPSGSLDFSDYLTRDAVALAIAVMSRIP
jgi:hypothetical protein